MIIRVTQEHIDACKEYAPRPRPFCPVEAAAQEQIGPRWQAGTQYLYYKMWEEGEEEGVRSFLWFTQEVSDKILQWDSLKLMEPFEFEVEYDG